MSSSHPYADRIARQLLEHSAGVVAKGNALVPYLQRYLAEHVGEAGLWDRLGQQVDVVDRLDPDAVASEAMRTGGATLPAAVLTTMIARDELRTATADERRFVRALAAARLGLQDPKLTDSRLRWTRLQPVVPHLALVAHTVAVIELAFAVLHDGRVLPGFGQ